MLKDGLYTRYEKPDYALAFHLASTPVDVDDGPLARRINATFVRDLGRQRSGHGNKRTWSRMISPISPSPI